jgi:hypothetical protein
MSNDVAPKDQGVRPSRKTLRLTFRVADGEVRLVRYERLNMITPPSTGERPEAGKHGGFWVELRDAGERALAHRVLHLPLRDSVEVFSPDGTIQREFGPSLEGTFEVLLPDHDEASAVVLFGDYLDAAKARRVYAEKGGESAQGARELARFELAKGDQGGEVVTGGGI